MSSQAVTNADLKSLMILLLLKVGARPDEIRSAMQMSGLPISNAPRPDSNPQRQQATHECPFAANKMPPLTPKRIVQNDYLAPMKAYAA